MKFLGALIIITGWAIIANHTPIVYCLIGAVCTVIGEFLYDENKNKE
jgi:Flp pilus assembly protein protease CpaA